ncbi:intercellular adhesion molecule 5 [Talpa occidentalis]|uniref:intercellular adhesion molecule 5 n=1 Tax=Talpa occidentalis TaxID=50954 RepID=UPI00188E7783|nr:intercellular adhesion molecule 5 [Talpa occidentalis]XP_037349955.1 intercellular adhesion molecule 5 [Talpa occidentalis]XP_037349956.1 intercellular adhesion molecule 5 [Talpa occidentalis]XP_037349957.1 intercellular adhesion molecule 5 [Talpa occidentalis]XP_037349958.1 intercellular adhesion molecule 5 [Talpa occidentalis]
MEMLLLGVWALLAFIPCPGATEELFEVSVWPDQALVKSGQSLMVNCSTTCPAPGPSGIETFLKKSQVGRGPQWKAFLLEDVTENAVLQCFFSCAGIQKDTSLGITVYEPPEQVMLELQPAWVAVDEAFTLKCYVPTVAPLENLTLTLLQGSSELHRKNFMSLAVATQRAEITVSVRAQREDDRCNFSCHAELDLSSHGGGLFHGNSATKVLRIFEFSQNPQIWVSPLLEVGMAETVSCEVARVFPAKEAMFYMSLGDQELSPFFFWKGDTAWVNATVRAMEMGDQELSCRVSLGPVELKTRKTVHVYSFPPPVLEVEELYPLAGTDINVTCSGHVLTSPSPTLRLQGAPDLPVPGEPAWFLLTVREEDDGRNFSCEASLEVQGQQLIKTTAIQLHVLYKPRLEESSCPGNQTWVEGAEEMLACIAKGNPAPTLVCTRNSMIFSLEVPQKATQNHSGTYCCTATNQLGSVSKKIAVVVIQGFLLPGPWEIPWEWGYVLRYVLNEGGIKSPNFVIIIVALGAGVITITLCLCCWPCKVQRRKLPCRQKKKNRQEQSQLAIPHTEECSAQNC